MDNDSLNAITNTLTIRYLRRGNLFPDFESKNIFLYVIRTGAIEFRNVENQLIDKLAEGDIYFPKNVDESETHKGVCVEDTMIYLLPFEVLQQIRNKNVDFAKVKIPPINFNPAVNRYFLNSTFGIS